MHNEIPKEVLDVGSALAGAGFEAYAVGGCVRDILLERAPKDWDVATNARPEEIQKIFPKSFYENNFGTVTVLVGGMEIQITTYRIDNAYTDKRRPDSVEYAKTLQEDLSRRDFTINALAVDITNNVQLITDSKKAEGNKLQKVTNSTRYLLLATRYPVVDLFNGQKDLKEKIVRAVGDANERFNEDALRLLRAVRFATQLKFDIERSTRSALMELSPLLKFVSGERIRDELVKIIMCSNAGDGIDLLREVGLLKFIIPELLEGYQVSQNKHHIFDVYEHNVKSLRYAAEQGFSFTVCLAALLHDVGKVKAKKGEGSNATFYNHDMIGGKMTTNIMTRLKFSNKEIQDVARLVRYHLFYYNVGEVTASSVRRLVKNVGLENMDDLINVRLADRIGSGVPKAEPYKLRHFRYMVQKVSKDPISVKMLKVDGLDIMKILGITPGPKVGVMLNALFSEVLDDPEKNTIKYLSARALELDKFSVSELSEMIKKGEEKVQLLEKEEQREFRV